VTAAEGESLARIVVAVVREYVTRHGEALVQETRSTWAALKDDLAAARERLAVVEVRQPIPGPMGPAGRDGVDGVGFDDLRVDHDGERTFTITAVRGAVVKSLGTFTVPVPLYREVWIDGRTYEPGDSVTWAGSEWHCRTTTTTKPGDGSKAWTLKVKRGRDGKDGKDGSSGPPGPAGRDWQQVYDDTRKR
jgi:integrin beta 3